MKNNALVVVGAVFLVLLVGWFATRGERKVGVKELKVEKIAADTVTKIDITVPGKAAPKKPDVTLGDGPVDDKDEKKPPTVVILEKDGAGFVVTGADGKKKPVDDAQLKPLLDAIGEFATGDLVSNKKEKLKDFEIDDELGSRVVITTTKGKALDLVFGRAAKGGGTTVRAQGSNDVFVAKGRLGSLLKKDAAAWRKKAIVDKKPEDFSSITIARADGSKIVLTGESKEEPAPVPEVVPGEEPKEPPKPKVTTTWKLTDPATLPAGFRLDESAVGRVASSFATLRASDFADDSKDGVGFEAPHTVITARLKDGKDLVLHLGTKDDKKRHFARMDGSPQVYLVPEFSAKNVDKGLDDLRDLSLFTAKIEDVKTMTLTSGKTRVVVEKAGEEWKLIDPKTPPAEFDVAQIASAVSGALRNKGARIAVDVADAGGSDPMIEVKLASGKTESLRFGKPVPPEDPSTAKPDDKPREYYVKGADGLVYVVNSFTRGRYEKPTELFKKPAAPPPGMGGAGGMSGLESLPPDVRKKLEASLKNKGLPQR
ncbi:MAG: DUF4340 domain-containing protein [Deltaproteobacteria bacterium]|nr:DUF4340 domain-containing protein [Deltaproteobacteria bacterium]